jgi:O-antigen ligase
MQSRTTAVLVAGFALLSSIVLIEPAPCDALFIALLVWMALTQRLPVAVKPLVLVLALFIAANLFTVLFQDNQVFGIQTTMIRTYLALVCVVFFVAFYYADERSIRTILRGLVAGAAINSIIVLAAVLTGDSRLSFVYDGDYALRLKGLFKDPNVMGPHVLLTATLVVHALGGKFWRAAMLALLLVVAVLSLSRATWIGIAFVPLAYLGLQILRGRVTRRILSAWVPLVLVCIVGGGLLIVMALDSDKLQFLISRLSYQEYDNDRFAGQIFALHLIERWPFGYGPGSTVFAAPGSLMPVNDPHNVFVKIATECGVEGLLAFLALFGLCAWSYLRTPRKSDLSVLLFANVVFLMICGMVVDITHWRHLYMAVGALLGLLARERRVQWQQTEFPSPHANPALR